MLHTQRHPPSVPRRPWSRGSLALIAIFASLPVVALGSVSALAATTTPSFPVPASAKVRPVGAATATSTTTTNTPTTTFTPQGTAPPAGTTAAGSTPATKAPTPHTTHTSRLSTLAIALIVLAALLILACAAWVAARLTAFEPHWVRSARHALAEGGFRLSATWAEFTDWVRLGR